MEKKIEKNIGAVNNEVTGLKTALIEGFDEMKDVLAQDGGQDKRKHKKNKKYTKR